MDRHAAGGGELLVADVALEVLRLLVLDEDLLVIELAVAVVAPHLRRSLLLLPHWRSGGLRSGLGFRDRGGFKLGLGFEFEVRFGG